MFGPLDMSLNNTTMPILADGISPDYSACVNVVIGYQKRPKILNTTAERKHPLIGRLARSSPHGEAATLKRDFDLIDGNTQDQELNTWNST